MADVIWGDFGRSWAYPTKAATLAEALADLVEDYEEMLNGYGGEPGEDRFKVTLYRDAVWCTGPTEEDEDCLCGMTHDELDAPQILHSWSSETRGEAVATLAWDKDEDITLVSLKLVEGAP